MENDLNNLNKIEKLPFHTHDGVNSPKVKVVLSDVITPQVSPSAPSGGVTVDSQARTAIVDIISKLETIGIFI